MRGLLRQPKHDEHLQSEVRTHGVQGVHGGLTPGQTQDICTRLYQLQVPCQPRLLGQSDLLRVGD